MDLVLKRTEFSEDGIFGVLRTDQGAFVAYTLERAYENEDGHYLPKIPAGIYQCKRGAHRLNGMDHDFTTFEVMRVHGHWGLLFHWGNTNRDSSGCILIGMERGERAILKSRIAFSFFMRIQDGVDEFCLNIE